MKPYKTHDDYLDEKLKDPKEAALYLNAAVEEDDPALLIAALARVARAHGFSRTAKRAALSRAGLYKAVSRRGNPEFKTFWGLLNASGLRVSFKPEHAPRAH